MRDTLGELLKRVGSENHRVAIRVEVRVASMDRGIISLQGNEDTFVTIRMLVECNRAHASGFRAELQVLGAQAKEESLGVVDVKGNTLGSAARKSTTATFVGDRDT